MHCNSFENRTPVDFISELQKFQRCDYMTSRHDDVIKWKHFPRYWPIVREIHRSPVNSPHKGQGRGALMLSLVYAWINGRVNDRDADDLGRHCAHYDVIVMDTTISQGAKIITPAMTNRRHVPLHSVTSHQSDKGKKLWPILSSILLAV